MAFAINVNGVNRIADVDGDTAAMGARDVFGMTGTKFGCVMALCSGCTVHLDRTPTRFCITTIAAISMAQWRLSHDHRRSDATDRGD